MSLYCSSKEFLGKADLVPKNHINKKIKTQNMTLKLERKFGFSGKVYSKVEMKYIKQKFY